MPVCPAMSSGSRKSRDIRRPQTHGRWKVARAFLAALLTVWLTTAGILATAQAAPRKCAHAAKVEQAARSFIAAARRGSPAAFRRALQRHLAMRRIAMFALGRHGRRMDPVHRRQYMQLTTHYIARQLAAQSSAFRNARVEITSCRGNVVEGRILPQGRRIKWRLSRGRIVDVNLDGIWLALALRDHYRSLLRRSNGDVKTFLAMLR